MIGAEKCLLSFSLLIGPNESLLESIVSVCKQPGLLMGKSCREGTFVLACQSRT
jgi:hypothetical protein